MEKKVIGYRLKDEKHLKAVVAITGLDGLDYNKPSTVSPIGDCDGKGTWTYNRLTDLGVLDLFFEPVYEQKSKLEVGRWYRAGDYFINIIEFKKPGSKYGTVYGICDGGVWDDRSGDFKLIDGCNKLVPATEKEIREMLIQEAKRRGFKGGVVFKPVNSTYDHKAAEGGAFSYGHTIDYLAFAGAGIYSQGKWAEIITEPKTFSPTMSLRWRNNPNQYGKFTLEQKHVEITTGEEKWEDVPMYIPF